MIQTAVANEIHPAKIPVRAGVFPPPCTPVKFQNSQTVQRPTQHQRQKLAAPKMFLANTSSPRNACQQALQTHGLGWQGFRIRCDGANHLRIAAKKSDQQQFRLGFLDGGGIESHSGDHCCLVPFVCGVGRCSGWLCSLS